MLITLIFMVRAAMVFIGFFSNWSFVSYFDMVYYLSCEILPIFIMFFILLWRSPAPGNQHLAAPHVSPQHKSGSDSNGSASDERSLLLKQ